MRIASGVAEKSKRKLGVLIFFRVLSILTAERQISEPVVGRATVIGAKSSGKVCRLIFFLIERRNSSGFSGVGRISCGRESVAYVQGASPKVMLPSTGGFELPAAALFAAKRLQSASSGV